MEYLKITGKIFLICILFSVIIVGFIKYNNKPRMTVRIGTYTFQVDKQYLANGKCYYIYMAGSKVFCIPCEETQ